MTLADARAETRIPVGDLARAREWYADRLGLSPVDEREGHLVYRLASGTFCLFASSGAAEGTFTQMALEVDDISSEVAALRAKGVTFEEYPAFRMTGGIADIEASGTGPADRAAWFHDCDGNLISLFEFQD